MTIEETLLAERFKKDCCPLNFRTKTIDKEKLSIKKIKGGFTASLNSKLT